MKSLGNFAQPPVDVNVYGVNFSNIIADPFFADNGHQQEFLANVAFAAPALGVGITDSVQITNRSFDYLIISYDPVAGSFPSFTSFTIIADVSDSI
jgi:hypothetical protein